MSYDGKTVYLCAAGGKGNIGAEAIMVAIIKLFQERYDPVRFYISSWYPDRVRQVLARIEGEFPHVGKESVWADMVAIRRSDFFVVCGDVSISETVVSFLPVYYALRTLGAKLMGTPVIFLGIEAETIRKVTNIWALKHVISRTVDYQVLRNRQSLENLREIPVPEETLLLGCEPALVLSPGVPSGLEFPADDSSGKRLQVGFGVRDLFTRPFKLDLLSGKLRRQDSSQGALGEETERMIQCMVRIGDYLVEKHDASLSFVPHHYLPDHEKVIRTDEEIAAIIVSRLRRPSAARIFESNLHPLTVLDIYRRFDLVFSMRHHASTFAYVHGVPTFGYGASEKIVSFFENIGRDDMLLDPGDCDLAAIGPRIDGAIADLRKISTRLRAGLADDQDRMRHALDVALQGISPGPDSPRGDTL